MLASAIGGIHNWFSWVVIGGNAVVGVWALVAHRHRVWRRQELWVLTVAAQLSVFVQAGLGSWLIAREGREAPELHSLYGFSGLVAVGIAYSYRQHLHGRRYLLYGFTGLFLMGLGIRALILD